MRHLFAAPLFALTLASPVVAQEDDGLSLMEEGAQLFLRGLMTEMEPAIEDLEGLAQEFAPALRGMADELGPILSGIVDAVDDIQYYREIEILENGDVLIRRSPDAPPFGEDDGDGRLQGSGDIDAPEIEL